MTLARSDQNFINTRRMFDILCDRDEIGRTMPRLLGSIFAIFSLAHIPVAADDEYGGKGAERFWPQWRGPLGTGVAPYANPPVEWSETKNVRWKTDLPGEGHSTPIVWGDRMFVTSPSPTVRRWPLEPAACLADMAKFLIRIGTNLL